jgi:CHAT domain-containing protein
MKPYEQAWELQQEGKRLADAGHVEQAHELFVRAWSCFTLEDSSAGAASAAYDLSLSYSNLHTGSRIENLLQAERHARIAVNSPERRMDPWPNAAALDRLAVTLRHLSNELSQSERQEPLRRESEKCSTDAIKLTLRHYPHESIQIAGYETNFATLLFETGRFRKAVRLLESAEARLIRADIDHDQGQQRLLSKVRLNLGAHLLTSDRLSDRARTAALARKVMNAPGDAERSRAAILLTRSLLASENQANDGEALNAFRDIRPHVLEPSDLPGYASLAISLNASDLALGHLHEAIEDGVRRWTETISDASADHEIAPVQHLAAAAARLYADAGDSINAFLELESVSGLRFQQNVASRAYHPSDPLVQALQMHQTAQVSLAKILDQLGGIISLGGDMIPLFHDAMKAISGAPSSAFPRPDIHERFSSSLRAVFEEAMSASDPVAVLQREALRAKRLSVLYRSRAEARDPTLRKAPAASVSALSRESLARLLIQAPDTAVLRVHLDNDLLAVCVWWDGNELVGKTTCIQLDSEWYAQFGQLHASLRNDNQVRSCDVLLALDLSAACPDREDLSKVIVLPDHVASRLPLGVVGPRERTFLERFEVVTWMPSLAPLRFRQAMTVRREGHLVVAPDGTEMRDAILRPIHTWDRALAGAQATQDRILAGVSSSDVVAFYTHGQHEPGMLPELVVADGRLSPEILGQEWHGVERCEIWACESGVEISFDPRSPVIVDEPFGLDTEFLNAGVRSTIGTLWPVFEIVTSAIFNKHRSLITKGLRADHALSEAQRWWIKEAAPRLRELLTNHPTSSALEEFAGFLGHPLAGGVLVTLGPAGGVDDPMEAQEVDRIMRILEDPCAWGGFRFMGVCEHRPTMVVDRILEELSKDEERELTELLSPVEEVEEVQRDRIERELDAALAEVATRYPRVEESLRLAELYRARRRATEPHNLIASVTWLYEALTALPPHDERRHGIRATTAVRLIELARAYAFLFPLDQGSLRAHAMVKRARSMVTPETAKRAPILAVLLKGLTNVERGSCEVVPVDLSDFLPGAAPLSPADQDAAVVLSQVMNPKATPDIARDLFMDMTSSLSEKPPDCAVGQGRWTRVVFAAERLNARAIDESLVSDIPLGLLDHRGQMLLTNETARAAHQDLPRATGGLIHHMSDSLTMIETDVLGGLGDEDVDRWRGSGNLGESVYWQAAMPQIAAASRPESTSEEAVFVISCLQNLADLRVQQLNAWIRGMTAMIVAVGGGSTPGVDALRDDVSIMARDRERTFDLLLEATSDDPASPRSSKLDPFRLTGEEVLAGFQGPEDVLPFWIVQASQWCRRTANETRRTAAAGALSTAENAMSGLDGRWRELGERRRDLSGKSDVGLRSRLAELDVRRHGRPAFVLKDNEALLGDLPPRTAVLSLAIRLDGAVFAVLVTRRQRRIACTSPETGQAILRRVVELLSSRCVPYAVSMAQHQGRVAWREVSAEISDLIAPLVELATREDVRSLAVFTPGQLRCLPIGGIEVDGRPLRALFDRVMHQPSIGWLPETSIQGHTHEACLFPKDDELLATAPFGRQVVGTMRGWFPPDHVLLPGHDRSRVIVEADQIQRVQERLTGLRYYGDLDLTGIRDATAALVLEGGRAFSLANTRGLLLPNCRCVELWSPVSAFDADRALFSQGDRLPGMTRAFLMTGAQSVIDLAWPVHDLVRALVFERYYLLRHRRTLDAATSLGNAIEWARRIVRDACAMVQGDPDRSAPEILTQIDDERAASADEFGVSQTTLQRFGASPYCVAACSESGFSTTITDDLQWAAFRYWGA